MYIAMCDEAREHIIPTISDCSIKDIRSNCSIRKFDIKSIYGTGITMKIYIRGQYCMIITITTTIPLCDNYFLVVIIYIVLVIITQCSTYI